MWSNNHERYKIRKIGDSLGIVLPKEALSRLKVAEGDTVYMTDSKDGAFRLTALNEKVPEQMREADKLTLQILAITEKVRSHIYSIFPFLSSGATVTMCHY